MKRYLILTLLALSCSQPPKPVDPSTLPVAVKTVSVSLGLSSFTTNYPATATALNQTDLRTNVSGFITGIYFKEGTLVKKGQRLYEIDKSKYTAAYDQAQAALNIARANRDRAKKDADRYQSLLQQDAVARQQVDHALTDLQNAQLQVTSANSGVKNALTDLRYSVIVAPFSGIIGISQVRLGALVQSGQTLLNTLSSPDPIAVDVSVGEHDLPLFQRLSKQPGAASDSVFTVLLPGRVRYPQVGKITVFDRAVDPQTGTVTVRLSFSNHNRTIEPGMNVTLVVKEGKGEQGILIPSTAVTEVMGELFVFLVQGGKVHQKKISAGRIIGNKTLVTSGLKEGEEIVTEGTGRLREGSNIKK